MGNGCFVDHTSNLSFGSLQCSSHVSFLIFPSTYECLGQRKPHRGECDLQSRVWYEPSEQLPSHLENPHLHNFIPVSLNHRLNCKKSLTSQISRRNGSLSPTTPLSLGFTTNFIQLRYLSPFRTCYNGSCVFVFDSAAQVSVALAFWCSQNSQNREAPPTEEFCSMFRRRGVHGRSTSDTEAECMIFSTIVRDSDIAWDTLGIEESSRQP